MAIEKRLILYQELLASANKFYELLKKRENLPDISLPSGVAFIENGFLFTWDTNPDYYLEAEISTPDKVEWMSKHKKEKTIFWEEKI